MLERPRLTTRKEPSQSRARKTAHIDANGTLSVRLCDDLREYFALELAEGERLSVTDLDVALRVPYRPLHLHAVDDARQLIRVSRAPTDRLTEMAAGLWSGRMIVGSWLENVRSLVDARLSAHFEEKRASTVATAPEGVELLDAIAALTMRGGKRLRPALLFAAFRSVAVDGPIDDAIEAGAALELLQSYLLIHDDWMDHDEERRGGPSVHAALREANGRDAHLGASLAVLAGNLASAHAWELLTRVGGPERRLREVIDVFLAIHREVVLGQQLDLLGTEDVSRMQQLKTGSYTVRGPLALGAALGGASDAERAALEAFGTPLGEAFQMRDDLLGTFGDPRVLGKSVGGDLRAGKRTALIRAAEERASGGELATIRAVLGQPGASESALAEVREALVTCGARAAVEARAGELLSAAKSALDDAPLSLLGVGMLRELADRLAVRDR